MSKPHSYPTKIVWTGDRGGGTETYRGYDLGGALADLKRAEELHGAVDRHCFIARSVNFPVSCEASYLVA